MSVKGQNGVRWSRGGWRDSRPGTHDADGHHSASSGFKLAVEFLEDLLPVAFKYVRSRDAAETLVHKAAARVAGSRLSQARDVGEALEHAVRASGTRTVIRRACRLYHRPWHRYASRFFRGAPDVAEDVIQDALLDLLNSANADFTDEKAVNAWMRQGIRGAALRTLRTRGREVALDEEPRDAAFGLCEAAASPERRAIRNERAKRLHNTLEDVAPEEREAYVLRYLAQPPWEVGTIAERQGVSRRTVSTRLATVRSRMWSQFRSR